VVCRIISAMLLMAKSGNMTLNLLRVCSHYYQITCNQVTTAVDIATGNWLDKTGRSSSPGRVKNFLISTSFRSVLGPTRPPTGYRGLFPRG
jgi:hypothetical protein